MISMNDLVLVSGCCGATPWGETDSNNHGKCSDCYENTVFEEIEDL